jgi:poly-gamma-glutamate synthesis protein (capsule biosynthesis protein)
VIKALRVNAVSLANNHSANAGKDGLANTRKVLEAEKIAAIGGPGDADTGRTASFTGQNLTLHVIGVHTLASHPDLTAVIKDLKKTANDRVLVMPHWGAEYKTVHGSSQAADAHAWVDAGADLVIGAHPHVVQDSETYKGVPIVYSLGNFIFDQWFSVETQRGMLVGGEFTDQGLRLFGLPVGIKDSQPYLLKGEEKKQRLERIYEPLAQFRRETPLGTELFFPVD